MGGFGDPLDDVRDFSTFHWLLTTPIKLWGQSPVACCLKRQRAELGERLPSLGCGNYPAKASESGGDWGKEDRFTRSLGSVRYPLHSIFTWLKEKACGDGRQGGDQVRGSVQFRLWFLILKSRYHNLTAHLMNNNPTDPRRHGVGNLLVYLSEVHV